MSKFKAVFVELYQPRKTGTLHNQAWKAGYTENIPLIQAITRTVYSRVDQEGFKR